MNNSEQIRAQRAFKTVENLNSCMRSDFLTLAKKLPAMFQINGLLATWAFLLDKGKPEHSSVLNAFLEHLKDSRINQQPIGQINATRLFVEQWTDETNGLKGPELRIITAEAISFSSWLKRAAETLCEQ